MISAYDLTFSEYQTQSRTTAFYPRIQLVLDGGDPIDAPWLYPLLGLLGECGELAEKYKKVIRDDEGHVTDAKREAIAKERGDPLWYLARLSEAAGSTLEDDAELNLSKLSSRQARDVLGGSGDDR